eukprot:scaffold110082_cov30-Phaeocystis_antarctica.AAC.2
MPTMALPTKVRALMYAGLSTHLGVVHAAELRACSPHPDQPPSSGEHGPGYPNPDLEPNPN